MTADPPGAVDRYDGHILGLATADGRRVVVGRWLRSPWGRFADVMTQDARGHRTLLAPSRAVGDEVAATYVFDDVVVTPVRVLCEPALRRWHVVAGPLTADLTLGEAVAQLRDAGHRDLADRIDRELVGRNVLPGRWTFQIVEAYDDTYYSTFKELDRLARDHLVQGKRHLYEEEMKEERRSAGRGGHEATPSEVPAGG